MPHNRISPDIITAANVRLGRTVQKAPLLARIVARLRADKFDKMLAVGVPARQGSALAVHAERLTTSQEREAIARSLRREFESARRATAVASSCIPVQRADVLAAEDLIEALTLRLHSPQPVQARGMARLRKILSDGAGPMYRGGRGDLAGRLGAALAEL